MDFSEWVLYLTISVRITSCTSCPYDEFFLLSRIVHSGKSKWLCSLLKWLGFYPCLSIVTRRCDVCPHPLVIGMTDINLQPSELCSLILSCNSISPSSTFGSIFFLSWNLTLKVLYSYELAMYVAFVGDLFTHLWYDNQIGLFSRVHPNTHSNTIVVRNGFAWAVRIATQWFTFSRMYDSR